MKATRTCSVPDCDRKHMARGMCSTHYGRWCINGTTDLPPVLSVADRLAAKLVGTPTGCLEWTGASSEHGYGRISIDGKLVRPHRVAWELAHGPIPDGLNVLHHCDNPPCCQTEPTVGYPEGHLFLGTQKQNVDDMDTKGRRVSSQSAKTHCPQGHPYDEANTYVKPTGGRICRTCRRAADARQLPRKAAL